MMYKFIFFVFILVFLRDDLPDRVSLLYKMSTQPFLHKVLLQAFFNNLQGGDALIVSVEGRDTHIYVYTPPARAHVFEQVKSTRFIGFPD